MIETIHRRRFQRRFFQAAAIWLEIQLLMQTGEGTPAYDASDPYLVTLGDADWRAELAIQCRDEERRRHAR